MLTTTFIEIPQWGNATLIELAWLLSGIAAVLFCASHLPELWRDKKAAELVKREAVKLAADNNLVCEALRIYFGAAITGLGIYAATQPSSAPGPARITYTGLAVTVVLLTISFGTVLMSWRYWHTRTRMNAAERERA